MKARMTIPLVAMIAAGLLAAGCGGSGSSSTGEMPAGSASSPATTSAPGGSEAVPSEAQAAAAGDIPDNQVFLTYRDPGGGYSIRYPEGWARQGSGNDVTFSEKANVIHLAIAKGPAPSPASARRGIQQLRRADPTVRATAPQQLTIKGQPVVKTTYSRLSRPDPVTGKRLRLTIDRYEYGNRGRVAVLDLGTPVGVDNVDAYRMISESLTWR